jgi:DNA-binding transcriptional MerR regulator
MVYHVPMFTVKQLSRLAGVTPRTLRHYDAIGLLEPTRLGENGYRYYGHEALLRLQQILFYRELDLPLEEIKKIMGRRDFDALAALEEHRRALQGRLARLERLVHAVDDTILYLKGEQEMSQKQLFAAFSDEEQEKYAEEAARLYDPEVVRASNRKWKAYSPEQKQRILDEGNRVYSDLLAVMDQGASSPAVQACIEHWRQHMDYFWTPALDQLLPLAEHYSSDPRFKANFDKIDPRLADFMREAVAVYVENRKP